MNRLECSAQAMASFRVKVIMKTSILTAWPMLGLGGCIEFALNVCPDYVPKLCAHETKCSGTLTNVNLALNR